MKNPTSFRLSSPDSCAQVLARQVTWAHAYSDDVAGSSARGDSGASIRHVNPYEERGSFLFRT